MAAGVSEVTVGQAPSRPGNRGFLSACAQTHSPRRTPMSDAMCQTSRPMLHGLRPLHPHDEPASDNSRVSTSNVLIIDEQSCQMSKRLRNALALPEYQAHVAISSPGTVLRPIRADAYDAVILCVGEGTASEFENYLQIRPIDQNV